MNVSIVSKKLDLTEAMRDYVDKSFEQFEKYNLDIIAVKCIIEGDNKHHKPRILVEFTIQMAHRDTVVIKQVDQDFYAACDIALERAKKVLRRYKEKVNNKIHNHAMPLHKVEADIPNLYSDVEEDEVVPAVADVDKPMDVADAVAHLKGSNLMFMVFNDLDSKMRVLYRRKDGRFGLY
jgi:putative sigma-54 modulation protein